jgi:hypothetical protein
MFETHDNAPELLDHFIHPNQSSLAPLNLRKTLPFEIEQELDQILLFEVCQG